MFTSTVDQTGNKYIVIFIADIEIRKMQLIVMYWDAITGQRPLHNVYMCVVVTGGMCNVAPFVS